MIWWLKDGKLLGGPHIATPVFNYFHELRRIGVFSLNTPMTRKSIQEFWIR
jgi:hypothetical protein